VAQSADRIVYRGPADGERNDHRTHVDHLGARDELLLREDQERLAAAIPGSRLIVYPDTGHLVLWEQPERVASDLTDFVKSLAA
jgi:pimeloyl-ACP methyl ester carboxylesterase